MALTGIRPHSLLELADELSQLQVRTDQIELELGRLVTSTEIDSVDTVGVRGVGETAVELSRHLSWVHDELVGFSLDPYLAPFVSGAAARPPDRPSAVVAHGHRLDRAWSELAARPGAPVHGTTDFADFAELVDQAVDTREQAFRVMQLIAAGEPPSAALRAVRRASTDAPRVGRDERSYARAATLAMRYSATRVPPRAIERLEHLVTASTKPEGSFAQAVVHLAILVEMSLEQAASVLGLAINNPPWWGEAPLWAESRRPTTAEIIEASARVHYVEVLAALPAEVTLAEARQMIIDRASGLAHQSPEVGFALMQMADIPFGNAPVLVAEQIEVASSLAALDWSGVDINQMFSITALGAEALGSEALGSTALGSATLGGIKGTQFVGAAAKVGISLTFFDALEQGDYSAALEIALDSTIPAVIKALLVRLVPVVAGPIGWIAALVLTFTTFGGPSWPGPHRAPASAADGGTEVPASNPTYTNEAGVPEPQRSEDVEPGSLLAALLMNLFERRVSV